jgi:hypothetical protein
VVVRPDRLGERKAVPVHDTRCSTRCRNAESQPQRSGMIGGNSHMHARSHIIAAVLASSTVGGELLCLWFLQTKVLPWALAGASTELESSLARVPCSVLASRVRTPWSRGRTRPPWYHGTYVRYTCTSVVRTMVPWYQWYHGTCVRTCVRTWYCNTRRRPQARD